MVAADGETGRGRDKQTASMLIHGRSVTSVQTLGGVSIGSRNGDPSRKGSVVNAQTTKASSKSVRVPPLPCDGSLAQ